MSIKKVFKRKYLIRVMLPIVGAMMAVLLPLPVRNGALYPIVFAPSHLAETPSGHASGENFLFLQTETAVTAEISEGEVEYVEPVVSRGGLSISGVYYDDGIRVEFSYQEDYKISKEDMLTYLETHSLAELEDRIENELQVLIGEDNYVAVHFYSQEPLKYTTRFSINPIEGEWW